MVSLAAAFEKLFISGLILFFSWNIDFKNVRTIPFLFGLSFSIILLTITGITTPVLGALVRYKMPVLPFLMTSFIVLYDENKVHKMLEFLRLGWIRKILYRIDNVCFTQM